MNALRIAILLGALMCISSCCAKDASDVINELTQRVIAHQQQTNVSMGFGHWAKEAGLWPSYIHINFVGDPVQTIMRNDMTVLDENMFVTAWILEILLEAQEQNMVTLPTLTVQSAVDTLLSFRDHNYPAPCPIYSFWPQQEVNGTWSAFPTNIEEVMNIFTKGGGAQAFYIPADSDDVAINLSLGASLYRLQELFPNSFASWTKVNTGPGAIDHLTKAWKMYAYRPFVNDTNVNTIDPRTYYWMCSYLNALSNPAVETSFFTTWLLDIDTNRQSYYHNYAMPFNVNNVDASVVANTIQGITRSVLYGPPDSTAWFDHELQQIYSSSVDLVAWVINQRLLDDRPDIVLLYYMGNYNFYWFVSRTVYLLNSIEQPLSTSFAHAQQTLTNAMRTAGTAAISDAVQYDDDLRHKWAYWDNFLGVNDTESGHPKNHADDRIATTAIAVNALIDTWTSKTSACNYTWDPSTPKDVKKMVTQGVNWLIRHSDGHRYRHENAFFSGSVKGNDLPFWFPQNYLQYLNGTDLTNINHFTAMSEIDDEVITGFSGSVSVDEYQSLVNERWFGERTPTEWEGYNVSSKSTLIYWSSPDFTMATSITALGKYLQTCEA